MLTGLDIGVVCVYMASVLVVGGTLTYMKGRVKSLDEYYLADRTLPWWALAVADLSSYLDISGTAINTALVCESAAVVRGGACAPVGACLTLLHGAWARAADAIGVCGFFIEIRGGVSLMLAFQVALTGKLMRRSAVMTKVR